MRVLTNASQWVTIRDQSGSQVTPRQPSPQVNQVPRQPLQWSPRTGCRLVKVHWALAGDVPGPVWQAGFFLQHPQMGQHTLD